MVHNPGRSAFLQILLFIVVVLVIPLALSNSFEGTLCGILVFVLTFVFPGYLLLSLFGKFQDGLLFFLSPVFGLATITTAYDICARVSMAAYFPYVAITLSAAGIALFVLRASSISSLGKLMYGAVIAGTAVALSAAPVLWRSGRFSNREFVFFGPAGQDQLFHVSLLQRLSYHVPPDNFMVSGLRPTIYHYFGDLTLALILRVQNALHLHSTGVFDLFYRSYPAIIYFLLGALAYRAGRQLLGNSSGGVLGVLLLLGAGGLGWFFGLLQTAVHASHFAAMRAALFFDWASWDGVDALRPLVHRPAHYHSLLICLAAINVVLQPEERAGANCRRNWVLAGLLLGLMAGFNFTLAATFGGAAVIGCLALLWRRRHDEARSLAWLAFFIFLGSLPVTSSMLLSGFHSVAPGFPFRGPNLEFPISIWSTLLSRIIPPKLIPWTALVIFPVVAYGVKLFGIGAMARFDLGEGRYRPLAIVFAIVFVVSFIIGTFFPFRGIHGIAIVFLQPSLWILGLFSLHPIHAWLERNRQSWRAYAVWGMLLLTWVQALASFNLSSKAVFDEDTARALQQIGSQASPEDVVAYLPSDLIERPVLGHAEATTNYSITAMTGLDGYFSSPEYSISFAVPALNGASPAEVFAQAERLYEQRLHDVESFIKGDIGAAASARLAHDHVRWIVVSREALPQIQSHVTPWRKTGDVAIYHLSP